VSCVSTRMCVTVGSDGIAVVGMLPTRGQIRKVLRMQSTPQRRGRRIAALLKRAGEPLTAKAIFDRTGPAIVIVRRGCFGIQGDPRVSRPGPGGGSSARRLV
jgi:hypothetical protein